MIPEQLLCIKMIQIFVLITLNYLEYDMKPSDLVRKDFIWEDDDLL